MNASFLLGSDGGQWAQKKSADVGEDGSATRGDAVFAHKPVEAAQRIVDALSRLEVLAIPEEDAGDIGSFLLL